MARRGYPPEFRRRVVELVEGGRKVSEVATELEVSDQTIYTFNYFAISGNFIRFLLVIAWCRDLAQRGHGLFVGAPDDGPRAALELLRAHRRHPNQLKAVRDPPRAVFYRDACHGVWMGPPQPQCQGTART